MPKKLYDEQNLSAIASSIRRKNGSNDTYKVSEMAGAIDAITLSLQEKTVTENGTVTPDSGYNGLSSVLVNIPDKSIKKVGNASYQNDLDCDIGAICAVSPYVNMAYLQSSGTQYINTEYIPNINTKVIMKCNISSSNSKWATPFGTRVTNSPTKAFGLYRNNNSTTNFEVIYGSTVIAVPNSQYVNTDVELILYKNYFSSAVAAINEEKTIKTFTSSGDDPDTSYLYLFELCNGSAPNGNTICTMKLYECSIYEEDTLVHHYLPALDNNDVACLYDTVTDSYLYNAGTGTFTYVPGSNGGN